MGDRMTVSAPFHSEAREAATGLGWIVGVTYAPSGAGGAIHEHHVFATKAEAEACVAELLGLVS
jgi:hypothetical protein